MKYYQEVKKHILNKHLLPVNVQVEGKYELPKVLPYTGEIPELFVPYNFKVIPQASKSGIYCHIDDALFATTWNRPFASLKKVSQYKVAVAPDHTLWADGLVCENIEQLRRNRITTLFWQTNGVRTIQTASWANASSLDYAFDGLAEHSWTAIGHQRIGCHSEQRLFKYAIEKLIEIKHPKGLIIYGAPLDFEVNVEIRRFPSHIAKLRKL